MMRQMQLPYESDFIFEAIRSHDHKALRDALDQISKQITKNLLPADFSLAIVKKNNKSVLKYAAEESHWWALQIMVEFEEFNQKNKEDYQYVLLFALAKNQINTVSILLNAGTPIGSKESCWYFGKTRDYPLHIVIKQRNHALLKTLLQCEGAKFIIHKTNNEGLTPTQGAYFSACPDEYIESLIDFSKSLDEACAGDLVCYIDWMHHSKKTELNNKLSKLVRLLLNKSSTDNLPLHFLVKYSEKIKAVKETLAFLLANGFDQKICNAQGKTAVQLASEKNWQCAELLILDELEKNPNCDNERFKALHYEDVLLNAIKDNRLTIVKILLGLLEDNSVLYFDDEGHELLNTALMAAINLNQNDMVSLILQHGANCFKEKTTAINSSCIATLQNFAKAHPIFEINAFMTENGLVVKNNSHTLADQYRRYADVLFQALIENSLSTKEVGPAIIHLQTCYIELLKNDQKKLRAYRSELSDLKSKRAKTNPQELTATTQTNNPNTILGRISLLIQAINDLTTTDMSNVAPMEFKDFPEFTPIYAHLNDYAQTIMAINGYKNKIENYLSTLSSVIDKTTWYYTNFLGYVRTGIYGHMETLKTAVDKIKAVSPLQENYTIELLNIFNEVKNILLTIPANKNRDRRTQKFYNDQLVLIKAIAFRSIIQTATVTINTNHSQTLKPNTGESQSPGGPLLNYRAPSYVALAFDPLTNSYIPYLSMDPNAMNQFPSSYNLLLTQPLLNNPPPLYRDTRNPSFSNPSDGIFKNNTPENPHQLTPVFPQSQVNNQQMRGEQLATSALGKFSITKVWHKNETSLSATEENKNDPLTASFKPPGKNLL